MLHRWITACNIAQQQIRHNPASETDALALRAVGLLSGGVPGKQPQQPQHLTRTGAAIRHPQWRQS